MGYRLKEGVEGSVVCPVGHTSSRLREVEVDKVLDHKESAQKCSEQEFLVNLSDEEETREPWENVKKTGVNQSPSRGQTELSSIQEVNGPILSHGKVSWISIVE